MDAIMPSDGPTTFHDHFQDLTDPRVERTRKHPLINIAFIAVCAASPGPTPSPPSTNSVPTVGRG